MEDVEIVEVCVLAARVLVVAVGGDRGQLGAAEIIGQLARKAPVLDIRSISLARGDRYAALEWAVLDVGAKPALDRGNGRRLRTGGGDVHRRKERRRAAFLLALRVIADDPEREIVVRLKQYLAAQQPAVAVVDPAAGDHVAKEAVALHVDAVESRRDRVAERSGDAGFEPAQVIIADIDLSADFRGEARLGGDDRDKTRRRVAPEQRALRSSQHFDSVERPKLGQANARA